MTTKYNLIMVFDATEESILMCHRKSEPYTGLYNLLGGKIENGEDYLDSAYRELFEESGITKNDIVLTPLMDFVWHPMDMEMHVFYGTLKHEVLLVEEVHSLHWMSTKENFFDMKKFAGEGNIGHMLRIWELAEEK